MSKIKKIYECSKCGAQSSKWNGRCFECGAWSTLVEQTVDEKMQEKKKIENIVGADVIDLNDISDIGTDHRINTDIAEVDRVLGGGFVPGSLTLLSGEPGIGKSTILAQIANAVAGSKKDEFVVYVSGEESAAQVKNRLVRLKCDVSKIKFIGETNVEKIISSVRNINPRLLIVDSIQTVYSSLVSAEAGGVSQIRYSTVSFLELAKKHDIATILIGHITKDGAVAGPKSLEHIVDTVIYLECESNSNYRILRSTKNRFGSVNELGIFEMTGEGFVEIKNPSSVFLEKNNQNMPGSAISCIMEGTRPFMIEIQALVSKTVFGYPQRKASGFDLNRLQVLTAVLTKRAGVNLSNQDVVLNVVGGIKVNDPSIDLAVCVAIMSSMLNNPLSNKTIVLGEVGLGGEVRNVSRIKERLFEASNLGFDEAIIPDCEVGKIKNIDLVKVKNLSDIVKIIQ